MEMPSSPFKGNSPEDTERRPPDAEQIPREPEPGASTGRVHDDLPRLSDLTLSPNRSVDTEAGDDVGCGDDGGDGSGDSEDKDYHKIQNLFESSLVLNYMLSGSAGPTHQISIETISEHVGVERSVLVKALEKFTVADSDLDDLVRSGSPQKEVDRIRQLAGLAGVTSWDTIPSEGGREDLPRLPINVILELTLGDPWEWMGPLKEQTFYISGRIQFLWGCVEELLSRRHRLLHFSEALAKRDELRNNLIKFGLEQLAASEISRNTLKIQCFETLNLVCVVIEAFMAKIVQECKKGHTGESEEGKGSEVNEESGEGGESRDTTGPQSQSNGFQGENTQLA
ncbi:hypothetical protein C7212DRAFT_365311 [Tuber magnatum]|uniref:Uncharacterized protein n=1 Tax=Tuber magnatum TaxID=42249 RepID=A0A317SJ83_9PEZI|nr:hypothetical protein C7212DRAFT_365311 [Tuber magnatum]